MVRKIILSVLTGLLGVVAAAYAVDSLAVRFPGKRQIFADLRVDNIYTSTNKWKAVDFSRGDSTIERCVWSLFPQLGYTPCWYLTRHTMRINNTD